MKFSNCVLYLTAIALTVGPTIASEPSRSSTVLMTAANLENSLNEASIDFDFSNVGELVAMDASTSFTGSDGNGDTQSMEYSGSARAEAGFLTLRTEASGSLSNTYYNFANEPLVDSDGNQNFSSGSPSSVQVTAQAVSTDILQYGGLLQSGYGASYRYRITGFLSDPSTIHTLGVTIAGNEERYLSPAGHTGFLLDFYATEVYPVSGSTPQTVVQQSLSAFFVNLEGSADGSNVSGNADFFSTVTLVGINLFDDSGNLVPRSEWTVTSASGIDYKAATVPEPAGVVLALLGATYCVGRRRR